VEEEEKYMSLKRLWLHSIAL